MHPVWCVAVVTSSALIFMTGIFEEWGLLARHEIYLTKCGMSIIANRTSQTSDEGFKLFISGNGDKSLQLSDKGTWDRMMGITEVLWKILQVGRWPTWSAGGQMCTAWEIKRRSWSSVCGWSTVTTLALDVFKTQLDKGLSNLVWIQCWLFFEWKLD